MRPSLRIGTRGSGLALWQARHVERLLSEHHPEINTEIIVIKTTGDKNLESPLSEIGGKGVFVKEIEEALLDERIDIAVHSLKDVPAVLPEGLVLEAYLKRHDARDAVIAYSGLKLWDLPDGSRVGTGSLRRASQILHHYPGLKIEPIRGNVDTRVRKLREGEQYDAIVLALAGLERMGLEAHVTEILSEDQVLPAPGQGIVAVESRGSDRDTNDVLKSINHSETAVQARAERAFLKRLSGDCNVPLGCLAETDGNSIYITGVLAQPDGSVLLKESISGVVGNAETLGENLAEGILQRGGRKLLKDLLGQ
jgi:hydroxymethylbilane synthase